MKLGYLLQNVDKSEANEAWVDTELLCYELDLSEEYHTDHEIKMYYLSSWLCTDTTVGRIAIYLKGELVGMSEQHSRKGGIGYSWVSTAAKSEMRSYLHSLSEGEYANDFKLIDMEEECEGGYSLDYVGQAVCKKEAVLVGERVELYLGKVKPGGIRVGAAWPVTELTLRHLPTSPKTDIPLKDEDMEHLLFPWHLAKPCHLGKGEGL